MTKTKQKELLIREIKFYLAEEARAQEEYRETHRMTASEEAVRHYAKARALYTFGVMAGMVPKSAFPQFHSCNQD